MLAPSIALEHAAIAGAGDTSNSRLPPQGPAHTPARTRGRPADLVDQDDGASFANGPRVLDDNSGALSGIGLDRAPWFPEDESHERLAPVDSQPDLGGLSRTTRKVRAFFGAVAGDGRQPRPVILLEPVVGAALSRPPANA